MQTLRLPICVRKVAANMLPTESEEKDRQMKDHTQDANGPFTRFEQSFGGHVPVGDDEYDGDDDDGACSPPRSLFPISFDCLDSRMVGTEDKMHVESHVGPEAEGHVQIGKSCDVGPDQDKSHGDLSNVVGSDSTTRRRQQQTK